MKDMYPASMLDIEPSRGSQKDTFDFAMNTKQGLSVQTLQGLRGLQLNCQSKLK